MINGIKFRSGEVTWQAPRSIFRETLPNFDRIMNGPTLCETHATVGLIGKIGEYYLVITERNEVGEEYDYTIIPCTGTTKVRYTDKRSK
jgi:hypothetical protein